MSDPRERIETDRLEATVLFLEGQTVDKTAYWWLGLRDPHEGAALWPEVVAFARAILAADEAWKDGQPEAIAYVFGHGETSADSRHGRNGQGRGDRPRHSTRLADVRGRGGRASNARLLRHDGSGSGYQPGEGG